MDRKILFVPSSKLPFTISVFSQVSSCRCYERVRWMKRECFSRDSGKPGSISWRHTVFCLRFSWFCRILPGKMRSIAVISFQLLPSISFSVNYILLSHEYNIVVCSVDLRTSFNKPYTLYTYLRVRVLFHFVSIQSQLFACNVFYNIIDFRHPITSVGLYSHFQRNGRKGL
jgi:hypothetical protein